MLSLPSAVVLIAIECVLPSEQHDEARLCEVLTRIVRCGRWTAPLALERDSFAVMDGHHRLAAARYLQLARVPCVLLDYEQVTVVARRPGFRGDGAEIVARA